MIKDKLLNAYNYYGISERLEKGFNWLINSDLKNLADGKYYIEEENVYANVQSYETRDNAPFEAHRKYIDIQYMINGAEKIGITNYENCSVTTNYDEDKDIEFLICDKNREESILREGDFNIFFPQDAHQPSLNLKDKMFVKKVIVKVAI